MCRKLTLMALMIAATISARATAGNFEERWYSASGNHRDTGLNVLIIKDSGGRYFIRELDLKLLNVPPPGKPALRHNGEWYYVLDVLENLEIHVDETGRRVHFVRRERPHTPRPPADKLLLEVQINGQPLEELQYFYYTSGELVMPESTMRALGIKPEAVQAPLLDGHMPLHAVAGENYVLDYRALRLELTVPSEYLPRRTFRASGRSKPSSEPAGDLSAILGYDLAGGTTLMGERWDSALLDLALSSGPNTCLSRHLRSSQGDNDNTELLRLESVCHFDWPERLFSVSAGDEITRTTAFGQPVRYGGLRLGSDFALAPGLITQPLLTLNGDARVLSTLEVWVDQQLALRTEVPPGPFQVDDLPVQTGAGDVRAVLRNSLGERTLLSQPFYSDPALLAPGLTDWSVELGRLRENYATPDSTYTDRIGALSARHGLTRWLTLDLHAETQAPEDPTGTVNRMAGLGAAVRLWKLGVLEAGRATSRHGEATEGGATQVGFSRRGKYLSLGLRRLTTDPEFVQLGYPQPGESPAEITQATIGARLGWGVSLTLGGFRRLYHDGRENTFGTAALNVRLGDVGSLHLSAFKPEEPAGDPFYTAYLTIPLGSRSNASVSAGGYKEITQHQVGLQRNLPAGDGFGYRINSGERNDVRFDEAELAVQGDNGLVRLAGRRVGEDTASRVQLTGAAIFSRRGAALARQTTGSFAMVKLPADNVRVYHDERVVAVTDGDGEAVIAGLRPYEKNRLRLAVEDLPLNTSIEAAEIIVTPGRRQVVGARFEAKRKHFITATLVQRNGETVPAGARVHTAPGAVETETVVGYNGRLYMAARDDRLLKLWIDWPGGQCRVSSVLPYRQKAFSELGSIRCVEYSQ